MTTLKLSKKFFYLFLFLYFVLGIYLSLNVGITHDESHSYWVWELNRHKLLNVFDSPSNEIILSTDTIINAKEPIDRMVNFKNTVPINKAS